jgi:hypothetical protein
MELPDPPEGWWLQDLNMTDKDKWATLIKSLDEWVYGFGTTPRYAMLDALGRIERGDTFGRLSGMAKTEIDLTKFLKLGPKVRERDRRF